DLALREMVAEHLGRDGRLPPQLADYVIDQCNTAVAQPRGPKKAANILRDIHFIAAISEACEKFNLRATRNRAARTPGQRHRPARSSPRPSSWSYPKRPSVSARSNGFGRG